MSSLSYSFTFTIPANKKVYYASRKRKYGSLTQKQQHKMLCDLMTKIIWWEHFDFLDYVFEEHQDKRLHIHGFAVVKHQYINIHPVYLLRDAFYSHGQIIKIAQSRYLQLSDIQLTKVHLNFWIKYINKHQDEILFRSHFSQSQIDSENLDIRAATGNMASCQIETRLDDIYTEQNKVYRFKPNKPKNDKFEIEF